MKKFRRDIHKDPSVIYYGIFYGDGSAFFGRTVEDWKTAPKENVQLILMYLAKTDIETDLPLRESLCSWDYYSFDGKKFMASNDTRVLHSDAIIYGRWMDTAEWIKLTEKAMGDYPEYIFDGR